MIKNIYFVRHGHYKIPPMRPADYHMQEIDGPLTLMGIEKIVELGHKLKKSHTQITHIYTSPFQRTSETAKILERVLDKTVSVREGLHEGHVADDTELHFRQIYDGFEKVISEALEKSEGAAVIVSHDLPMSLYLSIKSGVSYEDVTKSYKHLDLFKMGGCIKAVFNGKTLVEKEYI